MNLEIYNVTSNKTGNLIDHIVAESINHAYKLITKGLKEKNIEQKLTSKKITIKLAKEMFTVWN